MKVETRASAVAASIGRLSADDPAESGEAVRVAGAHVGIGR